MSNIGFSYFEEKLDELEKKASKISIKECRHFSKEIASIFNQNPEKFIEKMKKYLSAKNEYVRIISIHFFKEILLLDEKNINQIMDIFENISNDWSGRVKNYGLIQAFQDLWKFFPNELKNLLLTTDINENYSLKIILLRSLCQFLIKSKDKSKINIFEPILFEEINSYITFDEPYFISGLVTIINNYGVKFPEKLFPFLKKWASLENAHSHFIIQEILSKKLGIILDAQKIEELKNKISSAQKGLFKVQIPLLINRNYKVNYLERSVQTLLHWINVFFLPFHYGANPYRGCEHGCLYCNARYTHEYLGKGSDSFSNEIIVKINAHKALERDLTSPRWKKVRGNLVNLGSVSDPYQPAEKKYEITKKVLEIFLKYNNPVVVSTKSSLILRDLDLLKEMTENDILNVMISISTLNEKLVNQLEAKTPPPTERLNVIKKLKKNSIIVGVLVVPIFPYINDNLEKIEVLLKKLSEIKVDYAIADVLNFKHEVKPRFTYFLKKNYPELVEKYEKLYNYGKKNEYADKSYLKSIINPIRNKLLKKYNLNHYDRMLTGKFNNKS